MEVMKFRCTCTSEFTEDEFLLHFHTCNSFILYFQEFDSKFGKLLEEYAADPQYLFIIRILLKQYITILEMNLTNQYDLYIKIDLEQILVSLKSLV